MSVLLIIAIICAALGGWIGNYKGYTVLGIILGALTGPVGLVIIAVIPRSNARKVEDAERKLRVQQEASRRLSERA